MAESLNLKVIFEAIDKLSPALAAISRNFDGLEAGAKAAKNAVKAYAPAGVAALAGHVLGEKIDQTTEGLAQQAETVEEARTKFEQIAGGINAAAAATAALNLANK